MQSHLANRLNLTLFLFTLFCSLMIGLGPSIWQYYSDPYDYMHQSTLSLFDIEFYNPTKGAQYYPRPFTVPLFYKMANSNPDLIIVMQKFIHALSTFFFASVIILYLKNNVTKIIFLVGWYLFMTWWNISGWAHTILSESLSLSLMFMWFGTFLLFLKRKNTYTFISISSLLFYFRLHVTAGRISYCFFIFLILSYPLKWKNIWPQNISLFLR